MAEAWSDDDDLWEAMAPALSAPERYAAAEADVASIAAAVKLFPGASVVDVGCGAGVHAVAFAARGYCVTAVDRTASLLRVGQERAKALGVEVSFVRGDMRQFVCASAYDLACSLYASFGYFNDETNRSVLKNLRQSLRKGGVLVLDVLGREILMRHWQQEAAHEIQGVLYAVQRSLPENRVLLEKWTVTTGGAQKTFRTEQRIYSVDELRDMLRDAGFQRVEISGAFDPNIAYNEEARRLVAFAYV